MIKCNLIHFCEASDINIYYLLDELDILSLHILHWYYIIKDWYIENKTRKVEIYKEFLENKHYINNNIDSINICNLTNCGYYSIIYNESSIQPNIISNSHLENKSYHAIYIKSNVKRYIIFNYSYNKKILLIEIDTLNIIEFNSIYDCIEQLNKLINNYMYQLLRIVKRL
jgi:hypothetical protein